MRRCSSKSKKCDIWNAKDSSFKATLEYVSSEDEDEEEAVEVTTKHVKSQELSDDVQKNADEDAK